MTRLTAALLPAVVRVHGRGAMAQTDGSGFFIRNGGGEPRVVTNHHVVWGATEIAIERNDGVTETAAVVGVDPATDLALLRPTSGTAPGVLSFGDDQSVAPGSWLMAAGSPEGVFNAVSLGILAARGRVPQGTLPAERHVDHLFFDAALGAGSSGGPLVNLSGRVVGVNLAILGGSRHLGVAVPSSVAQSVLGELEREGRAVHAFAGVEIADERDGGRNGGAARVTAVATASPAETAGVLPGDLIDQLDGRPLQGAIDLRRRLFLAHPGTAVRLHVLRATAPIEITLPMAAPPADQRW